MSNRLRRNQNRRGAAVVELAVALPLVVLLLLGGVEIGRAVMVQHSLQEAAHAGCRLYAVNDATESDVQDIVDAAMESAGLTGYSVTFDPPAKSEIDVHMEPVTVTVSLPYAESSWLPSSFLAGTTIASQCTMPADLEEVGGSSSSGGGSSGGSGGWSGGWDDDDDDDDDD